MKYVILLLSLLFTADAQTSGRSRELPLDTLAVVGSRIISGKDFLERFELMPWPNKDKAVIIETTKLSFLQSLVAEKLLALEASALGLGADSVTLQLQHNLERLFVRDEYYKRQVLPKITVSPSEIREGMRRLPYVIDAEVLGVLSSKEGEQLYRKIVNSKNKSKTFALFQDSLYVPIDTLQVTFGFSDPAIEEAVFRAGTDSVTRPIRSDYYGWIMLRPLKKYSNDQFARLSQPDRTHKVRQLIERKREDSIATKVFAAVTAPQRAEANGEMFSLLADSILSLLREDSAAYRSKNTYLLPATAISTLMQRLAPLLAEPFVTIASGNMTLKEVLVGLGNNYVVFPGLQLDHIRWVLNNNIKTVIQNELLAREGLSANLHQTEAVRHDIATWIDNRKSMLLMRSVIDTVRVSDDEIEQEYRNTAQRYGATVKIKVQEILVNDLEFGKSLRSRITKGEDFGTLARALTLRSEWKNSGGISPLIDASQWGELGTYAASAPIGVLNGPWRTKEGWTLFAVIERTVVDDSIRGRLPEIKSSIAQKLLTEKQQQSLSRFVGTLAKKYDVSINENALRSVPTTTTNMVTWRHFGFGGRIVAVPQTIPQTEWIYEWKRQQQLNQ